MTKKLLIHDATIVSMDESIGTLNTGAILIEGDRIVEVGPEISVDEAEKLDASGMIACPGFVDAHRHVWQSVLYMLGANDDLNSYFANVPKKLAPAFDPDDLHFANRYGAIQALDAGVTTLFDWCHVLHTPEHTDAAIAGLKAANIRAVFGYGFPNTEPAWSMNSERNVPDDIRRVRKDVLNSSDALVTMAMAIRGPEQSIIEVTTHDIGVGRDLGLKISSHVGNGAFGLPYKSIERMFSRGLLGPDIQFVHCNSLTDESIWKIADSGGTMAATPSVELQMQFGYPATTRFLAQGIRAGIGADVVTSTDYGLGTQMRATYQAARLQALECGTPSIDTTDVLKFATIDGARSIGLEAKIGSLTPGKYADVVLVQPTDFELFNDPVAYIVLCSGRENIDTVLVNGKVLKQHKMLQDIDYSEMANSAQHVRNKIIERSGFQV